MDTASKHVGRTLPLLSCCCKATYSAAVSHKVRNYPAHCISLHCCSCSSCSQQQNTQEEDQDMEAGDDDDDDDQPFTRKPFTRTMQKQERDALQKWVQCAKCAKWRKVSSSLLEAPGSVATLFTLPSPSLFRPFISPRCYKLYGLAVREILQGALHQHTASQSCCSLVSYTAVVVSRGFLARNAFTKHIHFCNLLLSCESGSFYLER